MIQYKQNLVPGQTNNSQNHRNYFHHWMLVFWHFPKFGILDKRLNQCNHIWLFLSISGGVGEQERNAFQGTNKNMDIFVLHVLLICRSVDEEGDIMWECITAFPPTLYIKKILWNAREKLLFFNALYILWCYELKF